MENHHAMNGKTHELSMAIFNSYVSHYQRAHSCLVVIKSALRDSAVGLLLPEGTFIYEEHIDIMLKYN